MRSRYGIEYHKGMKPDRYGPTLETGWYVRDDMTPGILRGPFETRGSARQELSRMEG